MPTAVNLFFGETLLSLQEYIISDLSTDLVIKVAFRDLHSRQCCDFNGRAPGWAASMIKVPVMIAAFRRIDEDGLSLDERLLINHKFTLDPTSEISYREQGSSATVSELLKYMILASCNESTNMVANRVGIEYINQVMDRLKCRNTRMSHLLYRGAPLVDSGIDGTSSNTTAAQEMNDLMVGIYQDKVASRKSCEQMRMILENDPALGYTARSVNHLIAASLPPSTLVGAKSGVLESDVMETAMVNRDYALTIMLNKIPPKGISFVRELISHIASTVFGAYYKNG